MMKSVALIMDMTLESEIGTNLRACKLFTTRFRPIKEVTVTRFAKVTVTCITFIKRYGSDLSGKFEPQSLCQQNPSLIYLGLGKTDFRGTLLSAKKRRHLDGLYGKCVQLSVGK